jgi:mono/diheme cytochrome c family protein
MAEAITQSTSKWADADLQAVATYLKDVKGDGAPAPQPLAGGDASMAAGKAIYLDRCSACHNSTGAGQAALFATLAKAPVINSTDPTSLIRVVLQGSQAASTAARPTTPAMPSFGWNLGDADVANVLTYVRNSWGNAAPPVTAGQVKDLRTALKR